jgi:two-component system, sensor histidine kinase and response regulator
MHGDYERCLAVEMDAYVAKPIRPQELFEAIERVLTGGDSLAQARGTARVVEADGDSRRPLRCLHSVTPNLHDQMTEDVDFDGIL